MGQNPNDDLRMNDDTELFVDGDSGELDRVHELSWALLDEHISQAEMTELEGLLRTDATARESYLRCTQLHAELTSHFAKTEGDSSASGSKRTPILSFPLSGMPLTGIDSPTVDDSKS